MVVTVVVVLVLLLVCWLCVGFGLVLGFQGTAFKVGVPAREVGSRGPQLGNKDFGIMRSAQKTPGPS